MTFLNPFVLFGLAAAAIPILIHLFNIRKLRTIEFSTLSFLKELNKNKIRKIKIRQWILLVLRTLLILLIVLAFSRPALRGNFGTSGSRAASTIVILLDNSASMSLNNERGTFLTQGQNQALQIISLMQENDEVAFLRLSDLPEVTSGAATRDRHTLESLILETGIQYSYRPIRDGIRLASQLLHQSKNFNKELYIITDGQAASLTSFSEKNAETENLFDPQVKIFYSFLSQRQSENAAIERTTLPPSLLQVNKPFTLNVVVKNYGTSPLTNHLVSVVFDGARVMQKSVSVGSGMSATVEFSLVPSRSGTLSGYVEMEADLFEPDDRYYFSVNIPGRINISIVAPNETYSRYIVTALNVASNANPSSPVSLTTMSPTQVNTSSLSTTDILIFSGIKSLTAAQGDILYRYVLNGGNLMFFPSADTSSLTYDYLKLFGLSGMNVTRSNVTFNQVDLQFPVFHGMFEQGIQKNATGIESPQITASLNATTETNLRSIISLSHGKSFLWLKEVGKGKLLGVSVPANLTWSDFPIKGIFVPLLYQSMLYLSSPLNTAGEMQYRVGEKVEFRSSQLKKGKMNSSTTVQLFDTEHRKIPLQTYSKTNSEEISETMFTFENPQQAGIYSALAQNDTVLALPVNVPREESDGKLADEDHVHKILQLFGIEESSVMKLLPDTDVAGAITQSRFGIELWRYFLIFAACVALIEMFIAREQKQQ